MVKSNDWIEYPKDVPFGCGYRLVHLTDKTIMMAHWDDEKNEWIGTPRPVTHFVDVFGPYQIHANEYDDWRDGLNEESCVYDVG